MRSSLQSATWTVRLPGDVEPRAKLPNGSMIEDGPSQPRHKGGVRPGHRHPRPPTDVGRPKFTLQPLQPQERGPRFRSSVQTLPLSDHVTSEASPSNREAWFHPGFKRTNQLGREIVSLLVQTPLCLGGNVMEGDGSPGMGQPPSDHFDQGQRMTLSRVWQCIKPHQGGRDIVQEDGNMIDVRYPHSPGQTNC